MESTIKNYSVKLDIFKMDPNLLNCKRGLRKLPEEKFIYHFRQIKSCGRQLLKNLNWFGVLKQIISYFWILSHIVCKIICASLKIKFSSSSLTQSGLQCFEKTTVKKTAPLAVAYSPWGVKGIFLFVNKTNSMKQINSFPYNQEPIISVQIWHWKLNIDWFVECVQK